MVAISGAWWGIGLAVAVAEQPCNYTKSGAGCRDALSTSEGSATRIRMRQRKAYPGHVRSRWFEQLGPSRLLRVDRASGSSTTSPWSRKGRQSAWPRSLEVELADDAEERATLRQEGLAPLHAVSTDDRAEQLPALLQRHGRPRRLLDHGPAYARA